MCIYLLILVAYLTNVSAWPDCGTQTDGHMPYNGTDVATGPYLPVQNFTGMWKGHPIAVRLPSGAPTFPLFIFMHGSTGAIEMYEEIFQDYASHGFIVMFPYIKDPVKDQNPLTTNTNGEFILRSIDFANFSTTVNSSSPLFGRIEMENVIIAGHSMGGTCSIMAASRAPDDDRVPPNTIKLVVTQHPGICGPFGPPPLPATWMKSDLKGVLMNFPVLFTTATNDDAFWPAPKTAEHEMGCFNGSVIDSHSQRATFVQFSQAACLEDGMHPPWNDSGHDCPFKNGVETPWVLTAMKLYAQQKGNLDSQCGRMLYQMGTGSMAKDPQVDVVLFHSGNSSSI